MVPFIRCTISRSPTYRTVQMTGRLSRLCNNRSVSASPRNLRAEMRCRTCHDTPIEWPNRTSREPLMQEAAAGGSQIHFKPALAFHCPITTPSRIPMVTAEILAQNGDTGRTSCSEGERAGEPGVLPMILFFLLLLEPSSFLPPAGRVVLFRGITPPLPPAR